MFPILKQGRIHEVMDSVELAPPHRVCAIATFIGADLPSLAEGD